MSDQDADDLINNLKPNSAISEDMAARIFAEKYRGQIAYCHDQGKWLQFDGSIWRVVRTPLAFHYARELSRRLSFISSSPGSMQKVRFASGVETFSRADPTFARTADFWDTDPFLLGTPEGTVDLRSGKLRAARANDHITKATATPPAAWADCPLWLEFLRVATGDDDGLTRFLQQMAGYALTGSTREHALFFIYGPGGYGKGVFLNTIQAVMADYATVAGMETFQASRGSSHPTDLAMLRGARLVTSSETEEGGQWAEARIKALTGGDPISARFMRQDFFTFDPQFTLTIVGNFAPTLRTVDEAMRRRFNIVPFQNPPKKKDVDLPEKLKAEWPAILRWMIDGCLDWQKNGLIRPAVVQAATTEYFEDQNTIQQWLDQYCEVDLANAYLTDKSSSLFNSWSHYAKSSGAEAGSTKTFKPAMERLGFKSKKDNQGRWFIGVCLKSKMGDSDD